LLRRVRREVVPLMNTAFLLMAQYDGRAVITVEEVCRDYFQHLSEDKFIRKAEKREIRLPIVRMESSQKATKGVHLIDLAAYLDQRREAALKEAAQMDSATAGASK
jgi:hypothetical protein